MILNNHKQSTLMRTLYIDVLITQKGSDLRLTNRKQAYSSWYIKCCGFSHLVFTSHKFTRIHLKSDPNTELERSLHFHLLLTKKLLPFICLSVQSTSMQNI